MVEYIESKTTEERYLICDECKIEIDKCDRCDIPFIKEAVVYCSDFTGEYCHICQKCYNEIKDS